MVGPLTITREHQNTKRTSKYWSLKKPDSMKEKFTILKIILLLKQIICYIVFIFILLMNKYVHIFNSINKIIVTLRCAIQCIKLQPNVIFNSQHNEMIQNKKL